MGDPFADPVSTGKPSHSSVFPAAFGGTCGECGAFIDEGDSVGYVDDELVCEYCHREATA